MTNKFPIGQSFQRLNDSPLDETVVFDTLAQAQDYAKNNPTAYKGQVVHIKDARTPSEKDEGIFVYEETCYIDLFKNIVPICSFTYEAMGMFFDLIYEILDNPTEDTRNKLDALKEIMYDNYAHDFTEIPTGDYHTQPWHPSNYTENQIAFKMTKPGYGGVYLGNYSTYGDTCKFSLPTMSYSCEDITIKRDNVYEYYKVITLERIPDERDSLKFSNGSFIEKVIHMCDLSKITNASSMFYSCTSLTTIEDINKWNISNVTNMNRMFSWCQSLTQLDLSNWDTSNVTDMSFMFQNCNKLTSLNLNNFDTSNVTNMEYMFYYCKALSSLDVSNFDTKNVTNMDDMFANSKIKTLKADGFCVPHTYQLFSKCKYLTEIDMTTWDTSKVTDMRCMFEDCTSLTTVKGAGLDTSKVINGGMQSMFQNCTALTYLDVSNWTIVSNSYYMFKNCDNLTYDNVIKEECSESSLSYLSNYLS